MSSLYFPFDQLIRIPDFDSVDLFTGPHTSTGADSRSVSKQQGRKAVGHGLPKLDIIDGKDQVTALVECAGLKKEDIDLSLHDNILSISGKTSHHSESQQEGSQYKLIERSYGSFVRQIPVPPGLKESEINASMQDGLLKISYPKQVKESEAKRITIA